MLKKDAIEEHVRLKEFHKPIEKLKKQFLLNNEEKRKQNVNKICNKFTFITKKIAELIIRPTPN